MVKRDAHIDIVFRDGLKELEVLPPQDVWDGIQPAIAPGRNRGIVFRAAAGVAAMVSLGLLAWVVGTRSIDSVTGRLEASGEVQRNGSMPGSGTANRDNRIADAGDLRERSEARVLRLHMIDEVPEDYDRATGGDGITIDHSSNPSLALSDNAALLLQSDIEGEEEIVFNDYTSDPADASMPESAGQTVDEREPRWMVGAKVSPTYMSTNLKSTNAEMAAAGNQESSVISYTGGLTVSYAVGSRISVQTGLLYSSFGRQISDINSYRGYSPYATSKGGKIFGVRTTAGEIASTNSDIFLIDQLNTRISSIYSARNFDPEKADLELFGNALRQNFEYLEVPLMVSYKVIDRRVDFNILGGMSYNFLVGNSVYAVSEEGQLPIGSTEEIKNLLLSSALGMSMQYSLNDRFSLNLEPSFRYYLNSDGRLTANNPFTFGLFSGISFRF